MALFSELAFYNTMRSAVGRRGSHRPHKGEKCLGEELWVRGAALEQSPLRTGLSMSARLTIKELRQVEESEQKRLFSGGQWKTCSDPGKEKWDRKGRVTFLKEIMRYFGNPLLMKKKINSALIMSSEWGVAGLHLWFSWGSASPRSPTALWNWDVGFCSLRGSWTHMAQGASVAADTWPVHKWRRYEAILQDKSWQPESLGSL